MIFNMIKKNVKTPSSSRHLVLNLKDPEKRKKSSQKSKFIDKSQ